MEKLRHMREQAGYSQQELSDESGVSQHTISEIELGRRKPQGRTLRKLARVLGVQVSDFFEEVGRPKGSGPLAPQRSLFNHLAEERRDDFIARAEEYANTRIAHYEKRLSEAEQGHGILAGYEGARMLFDDAIEEFIHLPEFVNDELSDRWMLDPDVPEDVKVDMGRAVGAAVIKPFVEIIGRIAARQKALAKTQDQRTEAEHHLKLVREQERKFAAA